MKKILISIIVPVYNVEKYLDECVQSLLNQTLREIEIILVDDGSTDRSGQMCDVYAKNDYRVRVIHQKNGGQSRARNIGIQEAKGKYILFVDSDDYIIKNACEKLIEYATISQADVVWGDPINGWDVNRAKRFLSYKKIATGEELLEEALNCNGYDIVPWLKLVRKEVFINNNMYFLEGCFYEDQEYTLKMFLIPKVKMYRVDFSFYYYRIGREGSTTNEHNLKKGTDFVKVIKRMILDVKNARLTGVVEEYAHNVIAMAIYHLSSVYIHMKREDRNKVRSLIDREIRQYALKTTKLSNRMKFQNRIFIYFPEMLVFIFKLKDMIK